MYDSKLALITAWQQGEEQAIWIVFDQYYPKAVNIALLSGVPLEEAQDCAQEAFLRAFERRYQLRDPAAFPLWFHRIVIHQILDTLKSNKRLKEVSLETAKEAIENSEHYHASPPDEMLVLAEKREQLWRRVQQLPLHYRIPLIMYYYGDFSYREIAKLMGKREGTIRVIIHRALQQLRTLTGELEVRQRSSFQREPLHRTN